MPRNVDQGVARQGVKTYSIVVAAESMLTFSNSSVTLYKNNYPTDNLDRRIGLEIEEYLKIATKNLIQYKTVPHYWWKHNGNLPYSAPIARIYFSIQASLQSIRIYPLKEEVQFGY